MKVLLADDYLDTVDTLATLLRVRGHEVYTARTGEQAVAVAAAAVPDAALLDIVMPHGDGFHAAAQLRRLLPDLFLVAVTAWDPLPSQDVALFDQYLLKPAGAEYLANLLDRFAAWKRVNAVSRQQRTGTPAP